MIDIKGKRAFLTGASRGIGREIAKGLASLGCHLIIHARSLENLKHTEKMLSEYDVEVDLVAGELSDPIQVDDLLKQVDTLNKEVDIVYNCAAISGMDKDIFNTSRDNWTNIMEVNVYALIKICEHFMPKLIEQGFGRIVNVTSGIADQPELIAYSISKAAVDRYSRDFSKSLKKDKVLINCVDPGWIKTDLGGTNAWDEVSSVLAGMLVPVLIEEEGPVGIGFSAQEYKGMTYEDIEVLR